MFYNEDQKNRYIENSRYAESTLETGKMIFNGASRVEAHEKMDLANFNRSQVVDLLKSFDSKNKGYYKLICNVFSDYYNWCLNEGLIDRTNITNWYDRQLAYPIIDELLPVHLLKDKFLTDEDIPTILDKIPLATNKLLVYAPFIGINGESHEDLKHLRVDDLFEKRKAIQLHSGKIQFVDDLFIELLKKADEEKDYFPEGKDNGVSKKTKYEKSFYVFKRTSGSGIANDIISNMIITKRFGTIKRQTMNRFITISMLYRNGLINSIKQHYEKQGISLYTALFHEKNKKLYTYDIETQEVIERFGSPITVRMLRMELKDSIEYYM